MAVVKNGKYFSITNLGSNWLNSSKSGMLKNLGNNLERIPQFFDFFYKKNSFLF